MYFAFAGILKKCNLGSKNMRFMGIIPLLLVLSCRNGPDTSHLEKDLLRLETKIALPAVSGRMDHLSYDGTGHRVFVAALGNNTVEVVDLETRAHVYSIRGLREPQGVLYMPSLGRLAVANGGSGKCVFYDGNSYAELGSVSLGDDADNLRFDGERVYVGYGSGGRACSTSPSCPTSRWRSRRMLSLRARRSNFGSSRSTASGVAWA